MSALPIGIYERLLDEELQALLAANPELKPVLRAIDDEASPHSYAQFVGQLVKQALRITKKDQRVDIVNRLIELLSSTDGLGYLERKRLLHIEQNLLTEVNTTGSNQARPETPLSVSTLLSGQGADPPKAFTLGKSINDDTEQYNRPKLYPFQGSWIHHSFLCQVGKAH